MQAYAYEPPGKPGPFPLILYLHGSGETGGLLNGTLSEGARGTPLVELWRKTAIHELADNFAVVGPHSLTAWSPRTITKFLDFLLSPRSGLRIDRRRVYVTGHSSGGRACMAAAATGRFAAAVPVAASPPRSAASLGGVPIWAFHGKNDVIVDSVPMEEFVEDLRRRGAKAEDARLTLYDSAPAPFGWPTYHGHASTIPAYATPALYQWLLRYSVP